MGGTSAVAVLVCDCVVQRIRERTWALRIGAFKDQATILYSTIIVLWNAQPLVLPGAFARPASHKTRPDAIRVSGPAGESWPGLVLLNSCPFLVTPPPGPAKRFFLGKGSALYFLPCESPPLRSLPRFSLPLSFQSHTFVFPSTSSFP